MATALRLVGVGYIAWSELYSGNGPGFVSAFRAMGIFAAGYSWRSWIISWSRTG